MGRRRHQEAASQGRLTASLGAMGIPGPQARSSDLHIERRFRAYKVEMEPKLFRIRSMSPPTTVRMAI